MKPSMLYRMTRGLGEEAFRTYDLPPEDIEVQTSEESVHLRFLAGASVIILDYFSQQFKRHNLNAMVLSSLIASDSYANSIG